LLEAGWEVGLEVNTENTQECVVSRHQNAGHNHNLLTVNKSLKMWHSSSTWEQH